MGANKWILAKRHHDGALTTTGGLWDYTKKNNAQEFGSASVVISLAIVSE